MTMTILKNKLVIYFIFYLTFILSFFLGENSSGGSHYDSTLTQAYQEQIAESIQNGISYFIENQMPHSPIFYIIKPSLENFLNKLSSDLIFLTLSFFIPVIFYSILKKQFRGSNKNLLFAISLVLFFSPYLRSSAVWVTNDNLALLFFVLSLSKFLTYIKKKNNNLKDVFLSFFYLIIATYIRQYYLIIAIIYAVFLFREISIKFMFYIIIFNFFLLIPGILYTYNYLQFNAGYIISFAKPDFIFTPLVFFTMYLFYMSPFFFSYENYLKMKESYNERKIYFLILTFVFVLTFFYYELPLKEYGGGIIYKISQLIDSKFFFIFLSYVGSVLILFSINLSFKNILILFLFCFMFPSSTLYQKYYDPLMIIIIFGMIHSNLIFDNINLRKINLGLVFAYFSIFLISANIYYLNIF